MRIVFSTVIVLFQELLLSGMPEVDVDDWERNTMYISGYSGDSQIIKVFFIVVFWYLGFDEDVFCSRVK